MKSSRQLVLDSIDFHCPERIAFAKGEFSDIAFAGFSPADDFTPSEKGMDEWGCLWKSLNSEEGDQGQVVGHPLEDWEKAEDYRFPDPFSKGRFDRTKIILKEISSTGKFACGNIGKGPMHRLDDIRGFENYLTDLLCEPQRIEFLLDGIFSFLDGMVEQFAELKVDGVFLADDQAMQSGPLFSMDLWRQFFKPRYRALFQKAHRQGLKVFMHACGNLSEHLPELLEAGVDVLDNKQPALWMDSPGAESVRGKMTFSTCVDIQTTIFEIDESDIEEETHRLIRSLSLPEGGFIATYYNQPDMKIPPEKIKLMLDAFRSFKWN